MTEFHIPVIDPSAADGIFTLAWLVVALPLAGAVILLVGGRRTDAFGHILGCVTVGLSFVISLAMFIALLGRDEGDRQVHQHLFDWIHVRGFEVDYVVDFEGVRLGAVRVD